MERLDSDSLHALFDTYTTKSERTKRKKAEQTAGEKVAKNLHQRINYEPDKRKKAYDESKTQMRRKGQFVSLCVQDEHPWGCPCAM